MHHSLRLVIASLLVLSAACDTLGIESPSIHLASELDVGRDLMKGCSSILHEAAPLCSSRTPFRLYAEPSSACKTYFWCSPGRGACLMACPEGKVFNAAANSCQQISASLTFDTTTCTSTSTTTQRRKLLSADITTAQPPIKQSIQEPAAAGTQTPPSAHDDSTVIYNAATGVATDSMGRTLPLPQRRPGPPAFGTWTPYGKQYSTGPFAGSNTVKEPAVGSPRNAAPTHLPSSSSRGPVTNEIGSRSGSSSSGTFSKPPVYAEDDSVAAGGRALLAAQHSAAQHATARQLSMKRMPPGTTTTPAAASAAVTTAAVAANVVRPAGPNRPAHTRPASTAAAAAAPKVRAAPAPPTAAKGLSPDDVDVMPVTVSVASVDATDAADKHHHPAAARLIRGAFTTSSSSSSNAAGSVTTPSSSSARSASSTPSSSSSSSGEAVNDMGQLTGPEAEAARREFVSAKHPVHPHVVPLPEYLRGGESLHDIRSKGRHSSTRGSRGHQGHGSSSSRRGHRASRVSHRAAEDRGSRKHGPHDRYSSSSSGEYEQTRQRSYSRYEEVDSADSLQQ